MKNLLWVMAGLAVFAGIAANYLPQRSDSSAPHPAQPRSVSEPKAVIQQQLRTPLPLLVGDAIENQLHEAVAILEAPPGPDNPSLGLVRVRERDMGPHVLIHDLVSFGNATARLDPSTWRAMTTNGDGETVTPDVNRGQYETEVKLAAEIYDRGFHGS